MRAFRTADERFLDLPGYPYAPCYAQHLRGFDGLRLHYLDEGRRDPAQADPPMPGTLRTPRRGPCRSGGEDIAQRALRAFA